MFNRHFVCDSYFHHANLALSDGNSTIVEVTLARRSIDRERTQEEKAMEPKVTHKCKRTVVSSQAVQPGRFHYLSPLDRAMEPNCSVRAVFYYPRFPSAGGAGCVTARLRDSLSEALTSYPAATGRLQRAAEGRGGGSWVVKCNDAGVRIVEARAKGSVEEWLRKVDREREMALVFWEDMYEHSYFWSTFYVQMTEFEGGGVAIGASCSHMLADAACLTALVKAWADTTLLGNILSPPDFRPLLPPTTTTTPRSAPVAHHRPSLAALIDHYKSAAAETADHLDASSGVPQRFDTATFAFSDEAVRSIVGDSCPAAGGGGASPTAFQALAALFWASISRAKGSRRGLVDAAVCADARGALDLSKSFFGNAMVFNGLGGGGVEEGRLDAAAMAIADAVSDMDKEGVAGLVEWLEAHEVTSGPPRIMMLCGPRLLFANWEGLGPYVATFEPGVRPIRVSYYLEPVEGEGQVSVLPLARGHEGSLGRVVMVTLPEDQMGLLCEDVGILRYHPQMLMGPNRT